MRARLVVLGDPGIKVGLELVDVAVELLAEDDAVELVEQSLVETLNDPIRLRAIGLGPAVIDVLDGEIEFVLVAVVGAAIFCAAIGQHALQGDVVLVVEWDDPVVEQVGGGQRGLAIIELGEADLGIGVDEGLLVDPTDAFERADIEGILGAAVAGALALELAVSLLVGLGFLQGGELAFGEDEALLGHSGLKRLQAVLHRRQVVTAPDAAHAER